MPVKAVQRTAAVVADLSRCLSEGSGVHMTV